MKHRIPSPPALLTILLLIAMSGLAAAQQPVHKKPADAIFFEAESMEADGKTWRVVDHMPGIYTAVGDPHGVSLGRKALDGTQGGRGTAVKELTIPEDGHYKLWVRYLDGWQKSIAPFTVSVQQSGQPPQSRTFSETWLRGTPEMKKKWGGYFSTLLWDSMELDLKAGPCRLEMSKTGAPVTLLVDCFALTQDLKYEPSAKDYLTPLYAKVVMGGSDNIVPALIHLWGAVGHHDISKRGLFIGAFNGLTRERDYFQAGDQSPWVDIAPVLPIVGETNIQFSALTGWGYINAPSSQFTVMLSRTPSEEGLIRKFERSGRGSGLLLLIDQSRPEDMRSDVEWSRICRQWANELPKPVGQRPVEFPIITAAAHDPKAMSEEVIANDLHTLETLGFSGTEWTLADPQQLEKEGFGPVLTQSGTYHLAKGLCLNDPRLDAMEAQYKLQFERFAGHKLTWLKLQDEYPSVPLEHLKDCAICAAKFPQYLQSQGLKPSDFDDIKDRPTPPLAWNEIHPVVDPAISPKLFYHSIRFRSQMAVDFYKAASTIAQKFRPEVKITSNHTCELTSLKNALVRGVDIFEMYR